MTNKRLCFLDIETTGLDPSSGAVILTIGCVVDKQLKKDTGLYEFYGVYCPTEQEWANATPKALEVNGLTMEYLRNNGKSFSEFRDSFLRFLAEHGIEKGKAELIGQNPSFDLKFLGRFMGAELDFIGFPHDNPVDTRDLYSILMNRKQVPFIKYRSSENISEALGVQPEPSPHDALEGARAVYRNYTRLVELGARN